MGTPALIGQLADGHFTATYVHYDGHPISKLPLLGRLIEREGSVEAFMTGISGRVWGSLDGRGEVTDIDPEEAFVSGWGRMSTGRPMRNSGSVEGRYVRDVRGDWAAYLYLFDTEGQVRVYEATEDGYEELEIVKVSQLNELTEADIYKIECGPSYHRCAHMAWVHFPEVQGTEAENLDTCTFLGLEPLSPRQAIRAVYQGREYRLTGSGRAGGYALFASQGRPKGREGIWYASAIDVETGEEVELPAWRHNSKSAPDGCKAISTTTLIYPDLEAIRASLV